MSKRKTSELLTKFVQRIMSIQPRSYNLLGRGMPGIGSSAIPFEGAFNSGMDVTQTLKKQTFEFALAIRNHQTKDEILEHAKQVEGFILNSVVLNILTEQQSDSLVTELHTILADV